MSDSENRIIAEFFEHVAHDGNGGYVKLPAQANAQLYLAAADMLAALKDAVAFLGEYSEPRHPRAIVSIKCQSAIHRASLNAKGGE